MGPIQYMNCAAGVNNGSNTDVVIAKYDFAGNHLWSRHISGTDPEAYSAADVHGALDFVWDIAVEPQGRIFVGGWTGSWGGCKTLTSFDTTPNVAFSTMRTDPVLWAALLEEPLGAPATWASHFGNTKWSYAFAVAIAPLGYPHLGGSLSNGSLQLGSFTLDATWGNEDVLQATLCRF